ncbi:MAG TPA: imidazole glycerol phosphate synthase subunit HisH [Candidatus Acutalibacter pullistercoris]|uniref:Imidazole glycerol phosphate synthase subunit HisH n=1 Tax=Candidatus Acutalibacter pullistercoris TaxID=2838418 RepID=A0A9D1YDS5_9FIRM|nr:imidazole glycerol phosphate synthase subunit HisH [Candidatus Acutalibacter pullistercoris]
MIAIIDYGAGNLQSVEKALRHLGCQCQITADPGELAAAQAAVLPGVGAFGDAMGQLRARGLEEPIRRFVSSGKPFLGICLGLQILFEESEESPGVKGLGLLRGRVLRLPKESGLKIPHIGWNSLSVGKPGGLFAGVEGEPYVYFVHSYYLRAEEDVVTATAEYGTTIHAAVQKGNLLACQFHPEKSGQVGLSLLENFKAMAERGG